MRLTQHQPYGRGVLLVVVHVDDTQQRPLWHTAAAPGDAAVCFPAACTTAPPAPHKPIHPHSCQQGVPTLLLMLLFAQTAPAGLNAPLNPGPATSPALPTLSYLPPVCCLSAAAAAACLLLLTQVVPADLNAFLYQLETNIAWAAVLLGQEGTSQAFSTLAAGRRDSINKLLWDNQAGECCVNAVSSKPMRTWGCFLVAGCRQAGRRAVER